MSHVTLCHVTVCRETPAETAARECFEESLGVFGTMDHLLLSLRNYEENNVFKVWEREGGRREERRKGERGKGEGGEREGKLGREGGVSVGLFRYRKFCCHFKTDS